MMILDIDDQGLKVGCKRFVLLTSDPNFGSFTQGCCLLSQDEYITKCTST